MPIINNWILSGLASAICFAGMILVYKKLFTLGIKPLVLNLFMFGFVFVGFLIWNVSTKTTPNLSVKIILFLLLAAAFSLLGNYLDTHSIKNAPNPGYASTLKASQIVFITMLSPLLFRSSLNIISFVGVICVLFGIFLISK